MRNWRKNVSLQLFEAQHRGLNVHLHKENVHDFVEELVKLIFPQLSANKTKSAEELGKRLLYLENKLISILKCLQKDSTLFKGNPAQTSMLFMQSLPDIQRSLAEDARFIYENDPAAESLSEVIICYPGFRAIAIYRLANALHRLQVPIVPRLLSEYGHEKTGVDIHPAAQIGNPFFIDHGTGVVIGASTIIGDRVKIYQGVTLGALSVNKKLQRTKRHPTVEDDCLIYSNATVLGGDTVVGRGSIIGGNVWLTESVPAGSRIYLQKGKST